MFLRAGYSSYMTISYIILEAVQLIKVKLQLIKKHVSC